MQFNNQHNYTNLMPTTFGNTNAYFYQQEPATTTAPATAAPLLLEPYDHLMPSTDASVVNNTKNKDRDQTSAKDNNRKRPKRKQVKNACGKLFLTRHKVTQACFFSGLVHICHMKLIGWLMLHIPL